MKRLPVMLAGFCLALGQAAQGAAVDFAKDIQPLLQENCLRCHGPEKQKGRLRLDSREAALQGGEDGVVIVAGDARKSDLYRRITLPKGNDDLMPNDGDPLPKEQTDLIRDWINQGAHWPDTALAKGTAPKPPTVPAGLALPSDFKPGPAEPKAMAQLAQQGVEVPPVAMNTVWREANFRLLGTNVTDAVIAPLKELASLVDLNLGATRVTDAGLANLRGLTNLTRLHLELTPITDAGLAHLKDLPRLSYLNLYGTAVTDRGLEQLEGLKSLRHLYLWQTKVTADGVKKLREGLPHLDISTGWDMTVLAKKSEPATDKAGDSKAPKKEEK